MKRSSKQIQKEAVVANISWPDRSSDPETRKDSKKLAILRTAAMLFRENGYEATRLDDIAQALGVTKPTLYYYVKNKEDILVEIQQTGFREIMEGLVDLRQSDHSGADILRRLVVRYVCWITGEFGMCITRHFLITLGPQNLARLRRARRETERKIRDTIAHGIDDGSLRPCEPWVVSSAILGAMNWLPFWYEEKPGRKTPVELGNAYYELFFEGVGALGASQDANLIRATGGEPPVKTKRAVANDMAAKKPVPTKPRASRKNQIGETGRSA